LRNKHRVTVLLDVGESVCSQIFFSVSGDLNRYHNLLLSISLIWISHHHCDHICGFPSLLEQIYRAYKSNTNVIHENHQDSNCIDIDSDTENKSNTKPLHKKILVICPNSVLQYYEYCACIAGLEDYIELMPTNQSLYVGSTTKIMEATDGFIQRLTSIPVQHCRESYAVVLETANGLKLAYSGDCRPSPSIITAGMNCDLLIHEATFDDAMSSDAIKKFHSTTSEAVGMGLTMKCKHIILTHFSQRYMSTAQVELSDHNDQQMTKCKYSVAYDFMRFAFPSQINSIPSITRSISKFYEEYYERRKI
jgi:ribonuclease Z